MVHEALTGRNPIAEPAPRDDRPGPGNDARPAASRARSPPAWRAVLSRRLRCLFLPKLFCITAFIAVFFVAYFRLLQHPTSLATVMPLTALDALIPFQPAMLVAYVSLWFYVGIAPGLLPTLRQLRSYALWAAGLGATGLGIFLCWPTVVPPQTAELAGGSALRLLRGMDAAGNACPSMHVAFALFSAAWIDQILKASAAPLTLRGINLAWVLAIVWSTVAIRQHVVLDVLAGALLGASFAVVSLRRRQQAQ